MSTVSDSADEFVKIMLDGTEVIVKITGSMAKEMAVLLYAMAKNSNIKNKGRTRLNNMLKSKSCLKIFTIKQEDYKDFKKQAKRYGVLYSALMKSGDKNKDGLIDILVKEDDAVRVNRITERFKLTTVANIETQIADIEKQEKSNISNNENLESQKEIQEKNTSEELINKLLKRKTAKEENENEKPSNNIQNTVQEIQSENSLKKKEKNEKAEELEKPSLRVEIEKIRKENVRKEELNQKQSKGKKQEIQHQHLKKKKRKKERSK